MLHTRLAPDKAEIGGNVLLENVFRCQKRTGVGINEDRDDDSDCEGLDVVVDVTFWAQNSEKAVPSVMCTAAFSIWMDMEVFKSIGGSHMDENEGAVDSGGRYLEVV